MGDAYTSGTSENEIDKKIEESIQRRELMKLRHQYYQSLQQYYSSRKFKEIITISCSDRCLQRASALNPSGLTEA